MKTLTITRLCLLLTGGLLLSAGQQETEVAQETDPTGVYVLVAVDGSELPATVSHVGVTIFVRSGSFIINANGTCSSRVILESTSGAEATREVNATYVQEQRKLTMQWEGAGRTTGIVEGNTFTMNNEGMVFAYQKQSVLSTDQQRVLDRLIGTWQSHHKQLTPAGKPGEAVLTYSRVLGGQYVQEQTEYADGTTAMVMYTYDTQRQCYRLWRFPSTGQPAEATGDWDADSETLTWRFRVNGEQEPPTIVRHRFVSPDTFEWDVTTKDGDGEAFYWMEGRASQISYSN